MPDDCLDECNERATFVVQVAFLDDNGDATVPTAATYRVDDEKNRTNLASLTSISPLASSVDVVITADQNRILRPRASYEIRTLTVEFDYNASHGPAHGTAKYKYKLINLYGVVDVASASMSPSASASPSV